MDTGYHRINHTTNSLTDDDFALWSDLTEGCCCSYWWSTSSYDQTVLVAIYDIN